MKKLSTLLAMLMLAGCSGMGTHGGYDTSGSAGTYGTRGMASADDAWYATNPGRYTGDPVKSIYFGD